MCILHARQRSGLLRLADDPLTPITRWLVMTYQCRPRQIAQRPSVKMYFARVHHFDGSTARTTRSPGCSRIPRTSKLGAAKDLLSQYQS